MPICEDQVEFFGHPMVRSTHPTTIEVTRDPHLTITGDCIIGVRADKGLTDLSTALRDALMRDGSTVALTIEVPGHRFEFNAFGDHALTLENKHEMVIRKSTFISERTLAVKADAAAKDIPRAIVQILRNPDSKGTLRIKVRT